MSDLQFLCGHNYIMCKHFQNACTLIVIFCLTNVPCTEKGFFFNTHLKFSNSQGYAIYHCVPRGRSYRRARSSEMFQESL